MVVFDNNQVVGYLTTYPLGQDDKNRNWWEVGTGIVPIEKRGSGIGAILYNQVAKYHPKGVLVGTTKNPVALYLSLKAGFVVEPYTLIPASIRQGLCYTAPCFVAIGGGCCRDEHNLGGPCFARIRWPLS